MQMPRNSYIIFFLLLMSCSNDARKSTYFTYQGFGAGYPVTIEYENKAGDLSNQIKQLIFEIESAAWQGDSNSVVFKLNHKDSANIVATDHFIELFNIAKKFNKQTEGVIDPTLHPLLNYWGENDKKFKLLGETDSTIIDSLRKLTGFGKFILNKDRIIQSSSNVSLEFSQILSGYMIDKLANMFNQFSIQNLRIEINGTIYAKGVDKTNKNWTIGLDQPSDEITNRKLLALSNLNGQAVATAGSYRKYYSKESYRFSYTIDPVTGYPVQHSLIQVMVFAPTAVEAEVYAAAFLVMGIDKAKGFLLSQSKLQAYFITTNYKGEWNTYVTPQLSDELEWMKIENPI